jgi:hypothetical protein
MPRRPLMKIIWVKQLFDRMLNGSSSLSPLHSVWHNDGECEDDLVDYNEEDEDDVFVKDVRDNTMSAKTLGDNHADEVTSLYDIRVEENDKMGHEYSAQDKSSDNNHEGQPKEEILEISTHVSAQVLTEIKPTTSVATPVLTQQGIMDILSRQPHPLMQKMEWEQKKQCYKERLAINKTFGSAALWTGFKQCE